MPSLSGPRSPGTGANVGFGALQWSNPTNIVSSNNVYATCVDSIIDFDVTSDPLRASNYGFAIPTDATILGIFVEIERRMSTTDQWVIVDNSVRLVKAGSAVGDNKASATNWVTSENYFSYGGSTDLWGTTWTAAEINASDFGVQLQVTFDDNDGAGTGTAIVDHMRITVYYVESEGANTATTAADDNAVGTVAWSRVEEARLTDSDYADAVLTASAISHYIKLTDYGFSIDSGATIDGVVAVVTRFASQNSSIVDSTLKLVVGGTVVGDNKASGTTWTLNPIPSTASYGDTTDDWGATLTPANVNASNFGIVLSVVNNHATNQRTAFVDSITLTVYYTAGEEESSSSSSSSSSSLSSSSSSSSSTSPSSMEQSSSSSSSSSSKSSLSEFSSSSSSSSVSSSSSSSSSPSSSSSSLEFSSSSSSSLSSSSSSSSSSPSSQSESSSPSSSSSSSASASSSSSLSSSSSSSPSSLSSSSLSSSSLSSTSSSSSTSMSESSSSMSGSSDSSEIQYRPRNRIEFILKSRRIR